MIEPLISDVRTAEDRGCGAAVKFDAAAPAHRRVLLAVITIYAVAFLDLLADSATYAISLWAIGKSVQVRSGAALIKGGSLVVMALSLLGFSVWRATGAPPEGLVITSLGLFGFAANALAALIPVRFRGGDANVRSVWLCTRNQLIQTMAAAAGGALVWIDRLALAGPDRRRRADRAFLQSAFSIVRQSRQELRVAR